MATLDDDKVMDVSKPGSGRIVSTSRPVVAPVSQITVKDTNVSPSVPESEPTEPIAPSQSHKVIQPLTQTEESTPKADTYDKEEADKPEAETTAETSGASDAAGVDELAKAAESKKLAAKEAEAQVKKDEELQKLIDSKKYAVPIGHDSSATKKKTSLWLTIAALVIALLAAGYLLVDAGVIKADVKLPVEFFKEAAVPPADNSRQTSADETKDSKENESDAEQKAAAIAPSETLPATSASQISARDIDRKNEIKNLQAKLETYFNDNGAYPASLAVLKPALTQDQLTGPSNDAYTYTPSANKLTYTLSAVLENKTDKDAEDGKYVVVSIN